MSDTQTHFWKQAGTYKGNFFVLSWHGPKGKPHLKWCEEWQ